MPFSVSQYFSPMLQLVVVFSLCWFNSAGNSNASSNDLAKLETIRNITKAAWTAYSTHAWGHGSLAPVTKGFDDHWFGGGMGHSIVASMSTLAVMGLNDEFQKGRKWIAEQLDISKADRLLVVDDIVAQYVGALLSCYALSSDDMFLEHARKIGGDQLAPAYNTSTGIHYWKYNPKTGSLPLEWIRLPYIGSNDAEYRYLASLTAGGDSVKFSERIDDVRRILRDFDKSRGVHTFEMNVIYGRWTDRMSTDLVNEKDYYQNFLRAHLQSNGSDEEALQLYIEAMDAIEKNQLIVNSASGQTIVRGYDKNEAYMHSKNCYFGAMFALGAEAMKRRMSRNDTAKIDADSTEVYRKRIEKHFQLAENLTETCHQAASRTASGLIPWRFHLGDANFANNGYQNDAAFNLDSSELAESYFILWRLTHNPKYRDYAWELVQAIQKHCQVGENGRNGYSSIGNVSQVPSVKVNRQEAGFLSATLKYLYLTFTSDLVFPLDEWVFNSAGHPLPIFSGAAAPRL